MVDELELLKKDWKRQEASLPKVTAQEIYPMLLRKSSSVVKWIFIISIIEFVFWILASTLLKGPDYGNLNINSNSLKIFETGFLIVHGIVLLYFVFKFYRNFKNIRSTDSAAQLMENILCARKAVKHYIWASLLLFVIAAIVTTKLIVNLNTEAFGQVNILVLLGILTLVIVVLVALLALLYNKVYGLLLKRLTRNYEELKKMEV